MSNFAASARSFNFFQRIESVDLLSSSRTTRTKIELHFESSTVLEREELWLIRTMGLGLEASESIFCY
jgi:hypothetical protein